MRACPAGCSVLATLSRLVCVGPYSSVRVLLQLELASDGLPCTAAGQRLSVLGRVLLGPARCAGLTQAVARRLGKIAAEEHQSVKAFEKGEPCPFMHDFSPSVLQAEDPAAGAAAPPPTQHPSSRYVHMQMRRRRRLRRQQRRSRPAGRLQARPAGECPCAGPSCWLRGICTRWARCADFGTLALPHWLPLAGSTMLGAQRQ